MKITTLDRQPKSPRSLDNTGKNRFHYVPAQPQKPRRISICMSSNNTVFQKNTMKSETKIFTIILGYCLILWLTNWSLSHDYSRESGVTSSTIDLRGLGTLFGLVASVLLARRIWRVTRELLDARIRIPKSICLWGSWHCLLLLLPLTFGITHYSSGTAADKASIQTVFEYGGGSSWISIFFSGAAIMLFQLLVRLEAFSPGNRNAKPAHGEQRLTRSEFA